MLEENGVSLTYREYTQDPLDEDELRDVFAKLQMEPADLLRSRDATKAGLSGEEGRDELIALMAKNPRLLQRPIGILNGKAALGRPPENLLRLLS